MTTYCVLHKEEHEDHYWKTIDIPIRRGKNKGKTKIGWICSDSSYVPKTKSEVFNIGINKTDTRLAHWKDIKTRVTTHEGELLSGNKGRAYQQKYSRTYLGNDLSKPINWNAPMYQRELNKTK